MLGEQEEAKIADLHQEVRWVHFDGNGEGEYIDILEALDLGRENVSTYGNADPLPHRLDEMVRAFL